MINKVEEIRKRLNERKDAKEEPASWTTINGNHVPLDTEGKPMGEWANRLGKKSGNGKSTSVKYAHTEEDFDKLLDDAYENGKTGKERLRPFPNIIFFTFKSCRCIFVKSRDIVIDLLH